MMEIDKDKYEFDVEIVQLSGRAVLVDDGTVRAWLPLSQVEHDGELWEGMTTTIIIPEWLASVKEFV